MSKLKQLVEKASQKNEMRWRVYAYDPAKDNKLVHTSKDFENIEQASAEKLELLKKNPDYTIEVIAESAQKNEANSLDDISTKEIANYIKTLKFAMPLSHPMSINILGTKLKEKFGLSEKPHSIAIKALLDNMPKEYLESANIDVKNPGVLEVPDGKKVNELPQSHFEKLVDKKGYAEVIRALTNLEVWNKDKDKSLSSWASNMADKLKKKFRPESAQYKFKVGDRVLYEGDKATIIDLRTTGKTPYYDVEKDKEKGKMHHPAYEHELKPLQESSQKKLRPESIEDDKRRLDLEIKLQQQKIIQLGRDGASQERYKKAKEKLEKLQDKRNKLDESSQKNETRGYKVLVELGVPDNMNNRDIEDEVERLLRSSHKIDVVLDVTAERK